MWNICQVQPSNGDCQGSSAGGEATATQDCHLHVHSMDDQLTLSATCNGQGEARHTCCPSGHTVAEEVETVVMKP